MGDVTPLPPTLAQRLPLWARGAILAGALGLWTISVFEHEVGGQLFAQLFKWGVTQWGPEGARIVEKGILGAGLAMAAVVALLTARGVLRAVGGRAAVPELLARWTAWFLFALAANRFTVCLQSEDVHFAQYGFVAFCTGLATGSPRFAFAFATFLGFVDESNQWWRMYFHDWDNHLDWNDMILNACGAAAGALPFTSFARIRRYGAGEEDKVTPANPAVALGIVAGLVALAAYLVAGTDLGHYPEWPFWFALDNNKPFHVLTLREGLPALLGISYVLYHVVDERRRGLPFRVLVGILVAIHAGVVPPRIEGPQAVHERSVGPALTIPRAKTPPRIDGKLDPEEWRGAASVELRCFDPDAEPHQKAEESQKDFFGPEFPTRALVQWDDRALYLAFECSSADVWARKLPRDDPSLPGDSCVELFLDVDAAERTYFEIEVSPANVVQDLFCYIPEAPQWVPHFSQPFVSLNGWDARGLETAVQVQGGACELLEANETVAARKLPATSGYTVELALPWAALKGRAIPPRVGSLLRANLCRVEASRPRGASPSSYQTWKPTRVPLNFHRPQFFGAWVLGE